MHSLIDLVTTLNSPAITAGHGGICSSRGTDDFIVILRGPDYATAEHGPTVGLEGLLDGSRAGRGLSHADARHGAVVTERHHRR